MKNETVVALEDANTCIRPGEFVSLLGPSGCGKSTLLKLIAGLETPTAGMIEIDRVEIVEPHDELGVVFQNDLLMPWRTILENVLLQADIRNLDQNGMRDRALELLDSVGLNGFEHKYPKQLSGGMRQRVGVCRALLHHPRLLLMDEPFAALDAMTRDQMAVDLSELSDRYGTTVLFVTHSIAEAIFLSDTILLMSPRPGRIVEEIEIDLERPRNLHVRQTRQYTDYVNYVTDKFERLGILRDSEGARNP